MDRQHISDAAWEALEYSNKMDRSGQERSCRLQGIVVVTVEEWDAREAQLTERDAEIERLRSLVLDPPYMAEFDATIERLRDERNAEVTDKHAALTLLPRADHRLGRGDA